MLKYCIPSGFYASVWLYRELEGIFFSNNTGTLLRLLSKLRIPYLLDEGTNTMGLKIELVPDLIHCIETVAKREHAYVLKQLLASGRADKELQEKINVLRHFLETADFDQLRAESEKHLVQGRPVRFVIYLEKNVAKHIIHVT